MPTTLRLCTITTSPGPSPAKHTHEDHLLRTISPFHTSRAPRPALRRRVCPYRCNPPRRTAYVRGPERVGGRDKEIHPYNGPGFDQYRPAAATSANEVDPARRKRPGRPRTPAANCQERERCQRGSGPQPGDAGQRAQGPNWRSEPTSAREVRLRCRWHSGLPSASGRQRGHAFPDRRQRHHLSREPEVRLPVR